MRKFIQDHWLLISIIVLGFLTRLWGINYGLPKFLNCDEDISIYLLLKMIRDNTLNPHWFAYPQAPWFYINLIIYKIIVSFILLIKGIPTNSENIYKHIISNLPNFYLISRTIQAIFSTTSIFLLYLLTNLFSKNRKIALFAATLLALAPLPNYFTKSFARVEEIAIPFVLLTLYFLLKYVRTQKYPFIYLAAFLSGIALSIKWPFILIILCLAIIYGINEYNKKPKTIKPYQQLTLNIFMIISLILTISYISLKDSYILPTIRTIIIEKLAPSALKHTIAQDKEVVRFQSINSVVPAHEKTNRDSKINTQIKTLGKLVSIALIGITIMISLLFFGVKFNNLIAHKLTYNLIKKETFYITTFTLLGFALSAPYCLIDFPTTVYQAMGQFWGDFNYLKSLSWYISTPLVQGIGGAVFAMLSACGLIALILDKKVKSIEKLIFTLFPIIYLLYLCIPGIRWYRWMLPIIPFQAFYISIFLANIYKYINKNQIQKILFIFLIFILLMSNLYICLKHDHLFNKYNIEKNENIKLWGIS